MLRIDSKNMNFNGSCLISDANVASLNASVNEPENNSYISVSVSDMQAVRTNLAAFKADVIAFIDEIVKLPSEAED